MDDLYEKVKEIINDTDYGALVKLYSDNEVQTNRIISEFKAKKEAIIKKAKDDGSGVKKFYFDLDANEKDVWSIIFLGQYFISQWEEKLKRNKRVLDFLRNEKKKKPEEASKYDKLIKSVQDNIRKWDRYSYLDLKNIKKYEVNIKKDNYDLPDDVITALEKSIIIIDRLKDSLGHKNKDYFNCLYDLCIYSSNPAGKFEGLFPVKYLETFLYNPYEVGYYEGDALTIEKTNSIVSKIAEGRKDSVKNEPISKKFTELKDYSPYRKVKIDFNVLKGYKMGVSEYVFSVLYKEFYNDSTKLLKINNPKIIALITYIEEVMPHYKKEVLDDLDSENILNNITDFRGCNDLDGLLSRIRNASSHVFVDEASDNEKVELHDEKEDGSYSWGPEIFDMRELLEIVRAVELQMIKRKEIGSAAFSL